MIRRQPICPDCRDKGPKLIIGRPEPRLPKEAEICIEFTCGNCGRLCSWSSWRWRLWRLSKMRLPKNPNAVSHTLKPGETAMFEGSYKSGGGPTQIWPKTP